MHLSGVQHDSQHETVTVTVSVILTLTVTVTVLNKPLFESAVHIPCGPVTSHLQEPFGLTLIEAAAHGVPTVATKHGGPVDIVNTLHNGMLVEPTNTTEIADCLTRIITNPEMWERCAVLACSTVTCARLQRGGAAALRIALCAQLLDCRLQHIVP